MPASSTVCQYCEHEFKISEKEEKEKIIAELEKLSYNQIKDMAKTADFQRLHDIAAAKDYKPGWIYHQLKTIDDIRNYAQWKGYHKNWVDYQIKIREDANRKQNTANMRYSI